MDARLHYRSEPVGSYKRKERLQMKLPTNTKPMLWGAVVGAVLCAVLGFTWGGWVTNGTASKNAAMAASDARVAALAPICAAQFQAQPDAANQLASLKSESAWSRSTIVEKSGFATPLGGKSADSGVARACADLLSNLPAKT